jgi:hypothetical protein
MTQEQKYILITIGIAFVILYANRGTIMPKTSLNIEPNDDLNEIEKGLLNIKTGQIKVNSMPDEFRKEILSAN